MRILVIGVGGVGSFVVSHLAELSRTLQLSVQLSIADPDIVEPGQEAYQNFKATDAGMMKCDALKKRYSDDFELFKRTNERLFSVPESTDLIVICVDNEPARESLRTPSRKARTSSTFEQRAGGTW